MLQPLISVIVPCYNQAQYLDECLYSVLNQTYQNWECIIVDDGSPDNTEEIAKKWLEKDSRFIYHKKENGGLSSARNAGMVVAQGEWLQFLDCDDKITTEKFSDALSYFPKTDLIISNYQLFNETGNLNDYCGFINEELSFKNLVMNWDTKYTIPIHCAIFKKTKINEKFNQNLKAKEDWIFWLHYFKNNPIYTYIDNKSALYRMNESNMTKDLKHMLHNEELAFIYIYDLLDSEMKREFFKIKIQLKNNDIVKYHILKEHYFKLENKLKSKRYYLVNKFLMLIGK